MCEFFTFISTQELVHSTPNWLIVSLQSKFELRGSIFLLKSHHCETFKRDLTLFSSRVFPKKTTTLLRVFGSRFYLLKLLPSGWGLCSLEIASPSEPSCIKVSIPLIAMSPTQVGILIKALGSGGMQ